MDHFEKKPCSDTRASDGAALTILQRVARRDPAAVEDCLAAYGDFVWAAAKKLTASAEEAEIFAREIFLEIWKNAARHDSHRCGGYDFIRSLILRHLMRREQKSNRSVARQNNTGAPARENRKLKQTSVK